MKKVLFIMILATTLIPITRTGASLGDMNVQNKQIANEVKIMEKKASKEIDRLDSERLLHTKMQKKEVGIVKNYPNKAKLTNKRISSERRDRLFGLLLLAYGGQS